MRPEEPAQAADDLRDQRLLAAAEGGDGAAFGQLVQAYQAPIYRFLRGLVRGEAEAEDALQETFLSVWRAVQGEVAGKAGDASVRSWLFAIARHAAYRRARRRAGQPERTEPLEKLGAEAGWGAQDSPEALAAALESRERLRQALHELDEEEREVLWLRDVEGLSGEETAHILELSVAAMKSRLHRARLKLTARVRQEVDHAG